MLRWCIKISKDRKIEKNTVKLSLVAAVLAVGFSGCTALQEAHEKLGYVGYVYVNGTLDKRRNNHNIIYATYKTPEAGAPETVAPVAPATPVAAKQELVGTTKILLVNFKTDSAKIEADSFEKIKEFSDYMIENKSLKALVAGHTDSDGTEAYNMVLSKERARAVANQIVKDGVSVDRITSESYGETKPVASNKTAEGRRENRRIEALLR